MKKTRRGRLARWGGRRRDPRKFLFKASEGVRTWFRRWRCGTRAPGHASKRGETTGGGQKAETKDFVFERSARLCVSRTRTRAPLYFFHPRDRDSRGRANVQEDKGRGCRREERGQVGVVHTRQKEEVVRFLPVLFRMSSSSVYKWGSCKIG